MSIMLTHVSFVLNSWFVAYYQKLGPDNINWAEKETVLRLLQLLETLYANLGLWDYLMI